MTEVPERCYICGRPATHQRNGGPVCADAPEIQMVAERAWNEANERQRDTGGGGMKTARERAEDTQYVAMLEAQRDAYHEALAAIADADIRRWKAGWLQTIAKRALGRET